MGFRAPRQQHDGRPARPSPALPSPAQPGPAWSMGFVLCDIFKSFRPHIHRPHSQPITEGPFYPSGWRRSHQERCIFKQQRLPSRALSGLPSARMMNIYWAAGREEAVCSPQLPVQAAPSTQTDHARLLAPECCSLLQPIHPPLPPPSAPPPPRPASQQRPRCGTSAQSGSDSQPRRKKGQRDSTPAGRANAGRGEPR